MRQRLVEFDRLATEYRTFRDANGNTSAQGKRLFEAEPTAKKILRCLDNELSQVEVLGEDAWGGLTIHENEVRRGIGILADMDERATRLAPDAPSLPADQLHPWVWDAARFPPDRPAGPSSAARGPCLAVQKVVVVEVLDLPQTFPADLAPGTNTLGRFIGARRPERCRRWRHQTGEPR